MKLVVFGSTGGTGKQIVERALADGHDVVAVARRPDAVTATHAHLKVVKGDVLEPASVTAAIAGADCVLAAIGPANNKQPGTLISAGMANLVTAMTAAGPKRLVFESGLMMTDGTGLSLFSRIGVSIYRSMYRALWADKKIAEATILASALDYVIVRPPALDDTERGGIKNGVDIAVSAASKIGHADVARFMVAAASDAAVTRTIQTIGR